jgi:lactose/L-arabinose transport system permease protein
MFGQMNLLNTYTAVIMPTVATAFLIFFFRQNAMLFPREIIEAARVDGLNEIGIFVRMFIPTMKSTYAAAGIITFMTAWNNYLWPLIVIQTKDKITLPLIISNLASSYTPDYGMIMVAIILSTIPTALLFFGMQKHFVEGMVGSIK